MARRETNPELIEAVKRQAPAIGLTPQELLGIYSYETGGTLDPWQPGPRTKWGQHRGLIQWGEPQARKYGVTANTPVDQQVAASLKYLQDRGFKPGMGLAQAYAAVNAGGVTPKHLQARDAAAGGAPGTVLDKVNKQMGPHLAKAEALLGNNPTASVPPRRPDGAPGPRDAASAVPAAPQQGMLASIYEPFVKLAAEQKEQQTEQRLAEAEALANRPPPEPQPAPMQVVPAAPPPDFAALMFPRIRRGLLAGDGYGLLT